MTKPAGMDVLEAEAFLNVLAARQGIVAVVGAGGKKSTLHRLVEAHRQVGTERVALTTTVKMAPAAASLDLPMILDDADQILSALRSARKTAGCMLIAGPMTTAKRLSGLPSGLIHDIHVEGRFNVSLVKADGARMRLIKAPSETEPILPSGVTTILPIVSARAFGQAVSARIAHRVDRLLTVIDDAEGAVLRPDHVARYLCSDRGALQHVGEAEIVPVINMVDDAELQARAREAAERALAATDRFDRVVLATMLAASPVKEVLRR